MFKERYRVRQLEYCNKQMFGNLIVTCPTHASHMPKKLIQPVPITVQPVITTEEIVKKHLMEAEKRRASLLVDQLLVDIHNSFHHSTDYNSTTSGRSSQKYCNALSHDLYKRDLQDLSALTALLGGQIERVGIKLVRRLKRREALRRQQEAQCDVITCQLKKLLPNATENMCFTVNPQPSESGFTQWVAAMKMVAQLPGGIPPEFRRRLWLTMAEKHLTSKGVDWTRVERTCFSEWSHPEDGELGVQIVKDLHRTGCSLFCGEGGQENQALLKKVLLAYARWNKAVGYCQGFNMLAALILQVTEKSETDALKLMIYLIEGVLPDSYFADSLRGLSVDMAVFRELLRTRLPRLSKHLDLLQNLAKEGTTSYEPPLTNVFTMQWFLTLFCNCLPQPSVLRVWDLILLEGNEILLRTALAIWQALADRIVRVRTADEFYCIMGVLTNELLENNLMDANSLMNAVVTIGPLTELKNLREHYLYNINPWGAMPSPLEFSDKQLKLYPRERLALDISALKKQYMKLRQRQRQAHIIFTAAISRQPPPRTPVAMNHLLIGKSALVPAKRLGPPKGSIPPMRIPTTSTLHWKDASKHSPSSSSSDTELCDENDPPSEPTDNSNQESPIHELPQENPPQVDTCTNDVMVTPNISAKTDLDDTETSGVSDVFDTLVPVHTDYDVEPVIDVESEDDSVDFELFLEDRVKCFVRVESPTEEENRVSLSRRNSERALQIIQENSLILHRILQCQSRLSLSPPLTETGIDTDDDSLSKKSSDSFRHAGDGMFSSSCSSSETTTGHLLDCFSSDVNTAGGFFKAERNHFDLSSPEMPVFSQQEDGTYRSKYTEILERSRDLNAKYYSQILQSDAETPETETKNFVIAESKTFTNQEELIDFSSDLPSLIVSDNISCNLTPTMISENVLPFPEDTEKYPYNLDSKNDDHFIDFNRNHEQSLDVVNVSEFHLPPINSNQTLETQESDHVSISNTHETQATSCSNIESESNCPGELEIDSYQPRSHDQSKSPQHRIVWSDEMQREKELKYSLVDVSVTTSPSRLCDTPEETFSCYSKDSGTDSTSISERDISTTSGYKSKSVASSNYFSFDNISVKVFDKKSLSATNSIEKTDDSKGSKRSLSASSSIERATCPSSRILVDKVSESAEDSIVRLKPTIKSPEIPFDSSLWLFTQSSSSSLIDNKTLSRYANVDEKSAIASRVTDPILEKHLSMEKGFENENQSSCTNYAVSSQDAIGFGKYTVVPSTRDYISDEESSSNYMRIKSPTLDYRVIGHSRPTESISSISPVNRDDKFRRNISPISRDLESKGDLCASDAIFNIDTSLDKNILCGRSPSSIDDRNQTRSPLSDSFSTDRSRFSYFTYADKSPELSCRSPVRMEEENCKDSSKNHRDTRSPINDLTDLHSPENNCDSPWRSPAAKDNKSCEGVSPKSPSKRFNPFPVSLSSRQNKEVAVKLGLYKK